MNPVIWVGVALFVIGLFMLIAGVGPLWLPVAVILVAITVGVLGKTRAARPA
jgi:hypothetical protein